MGVCGGWGHCGGEGGGAEGAMHEWGPWGSFVADVASLHCAMWSWGSFVADVASLHCAMWSCCSALALPRGGMTGTIPASISQLSSMTRLDLGTNALEVGWVWARSCGPWTGEPAYVRVCVLCVRPKGWLCVYVFV